MSGLHVVLESEEAAVVRSAAVASAAASNSERRCLYVVYVVNVMPGHFYSAFAWGLCSPASMDMPWTPYCTCQTHCLSTKATLI